MSCAFSMAELMVAVVILGIGLLITTSMFPIAWLKARDVAESTNLATTALTADIYVKSLLRVNGPRSVHPLDRSVSSFFPGDWFSPLPSCSATPAPVPCSNDPDNEAAIYPDMRVHVLNTGNYGLNFATQEDDWLDNTNVLQAPVAANGWRLEEAMESVVTDYTLLPDLLASGAHKSVIAPHVRMIPPMEVIPDQVTDPQEFALWAEQFETRRHCWAVLYRMSEMPGPDVALQAECEDTATNCNTAEMQTESSLRRSRRVTAYYVTLKRLGSARYARQRGNDVNGTNLDALAPRAMSPAEDVLLPTPWRFEAQVTNPTLPMDGSAPQTGIPTEIQINDVVIADMVQEGSYLIDDRSGEVLTVAAIKESGTPGQAVLVLSKEYRPSDLFRIPVYDSTGSDKDNYLEVGRFLGSGGTVELTNAEAKQRFYWVFPPPVDATDTVRAGGVPLFDGPQPVVGIEVRQLSIAPRLGS